MTDRSDNDATTDEPAAAPPNPKVTRARTTAVGKPPTRVVGKPAATASPAKDAPVSTAAATIEAGAAPRTAPTPTPPDEAIANRVTVDRGGIDLARAEQVHVTRGGITRVEATSVDVRQGGISRVDARDVAVSMGGIAIARADRVSADMSAVALSVSGEARVSQSFVRTMFARDVTLDQGAVWSLAAGRVTFRRSGFAGVVIARRVDGDVRVLMDWRGAIAFGAVVGLLMGLLRRR